VPKNRDIAKLVRHRYSAIKTELETVFITSSGDRYLEEMDAICAESQIQQARQSKQEREDRMTKLVDILFDILKQNNWGVFYKANPMHLLSLQDETPLLKINEVDEYVVEKAINEVIMNPDNNYLENWNEQKHTQPPSTSEEDSSQKTK
jgi:hypothetical protein